MRRSMIVAVAACGLMITMLTVAMPAFAGEEEDRVKDVENSLTRMKEKLDGVASKSSSSDVEEAIREAYRVKEAADKLKSMNAQNEPGKTMAGSYPGWVDKFQESTRYLKDMKEAQLKADNDRLGERCTEADKNFRSLINGYVEKKDKAEGRKGLNVIPEEADKIGRSYGEELKKMEEKHREMEGWRSYAKNFSESHQRWSDVKDKLHSGANDTWERWSKRMEAARYCQQLAKGKDNPIVVDALQKLGSQNKQMDDMYKELRAKYKEWRNDMNSFREAALQDARELKELFCSKLDWERRAQQVADKYASDLRSRWDRLTADRDRMLNTADLLINMGATNAPKVKRLIVQAWDKVEPIKDGELKGANHPMIRAQIEKGKAEHKSRQSGADMQNTLIDSSYCSNPHPDRGNCILDCVRGCTVIEIKPNNTEEVDMGHKQAQAYKAGLEKIFNDKQGKDKGKQSEMFTMNSGRYAHLSNCVSGSSPGSYSLGLDYKIETYGFCPGNPDVIFGPRESIPTEEPPEKPID
jgi:hypothetical protein